MGTREDVRAIVLGSAVKVMDLDEEKRKEVKTVDAMPVEPKPVVVPKVKVKDLRNKVHIPGKTGGAAWIESVSGSVYVYTLADGPGSGYTMFDLSTVLSFNSDFVAFLPPKTSSSQSGWNTALPYIKSGVLPIVEEGFVVCGNQRIGMIDGEQIPFNMKPYTDKAQFPADVLIESDAFRAATIHASKDLVKPVFNAVCLRRTDGSWSLCSSDSRRASVIYQAGGFAIIREEIINDVKGDVFLPLFASVAKSDIEVAILEGDWVLIRYDNVVVRYRVDGQFPNLDACIPKEFDQILSFSSQGIEFLKTVAKIGKSPSYKAILRPDGSIESDFGKQEDGAAFGSDPMTIGFNAQYMLDAIKFVDIAGPVVVRVNGPMSPIVFGGGSGRLSIVMPIQVKE